MGALKKFKSLIPFMPIKAILPANPTPEEKAEYEKRLAILRKRYPVPFTPEITPDLEED